MNCEIVQARLQDFQDGKLSGVERRELEAHLDGCGECAALAALMRLDAPAEAALDLVAPVLERTSGSACSRAREILCDFIDRSLGGVDVELLRQHVDGCGACAALAAALERLGEDLPAMARLEPAAGFVERVLAATLPRPGRWAKLTDRWARGWAALIARPRIAWEGGYVGAVGVWLVVSIFGAPFQASTALPSAESSVQMVEEVTSHVARFGRRTWDVTGGRGVDTWTGLRTDVRERYRRTEGALGDLRQDGERLKDALFRFDLRGSGRAWTELTNDARSVWERFSTDQETPEAATE
jgi:predicted anti-sigma-YlaC factor YlaD